MVPLLVPYRNDLDGLIASAAAQTAMTHNHPLVLNTAEFFARVGWHVLDGETPEAAMARAAETPGTDESFQQLIEDGAASRELDTRQAIAGFGQMCEAEAALPATVHLIAKYEDDLKTALVENVMAGGDSSARGIFVGMVLGARNGEDAVPRQWLDGLNRLAHIKTLLERLE
jgi:ADP-ribosylglycohydrolase